MMLCYKDNSLPVIQSLFFFFFYLEGYAIFAVLLPAPKYCMQLVGCLSGLCVCLFRPGWALGPVGLTQWLAILFMILYEFCGCISVSVRVCALI